MKFPVSVPALIGLIFLLHCPLAVAENTPARTVLDQSLPESGSPSPIVQSAPAASPAISDYTGRVRVYIVEPVSRWRDASITKYDFGFLDFAINTPLSIPYLDTYTETKIWDGASVGYGDVTQDNIMAIAAVFNSESVRAYSDPPSGAPFDAFYVDAAAAAIPGNSGSNVVDGEYTHTVFVEEASLST